MTSETQLREIAATAIREHLVGDPINAVFDDVCCEQSYDPEEPDAQRIRDLIRTWPIMDLPELDEDGYLFPMFGRKYGHVRVKTIHDPRLNTTDRGNLAPFRGVVIGSGGADRAPGRTSLTLTKDEALELASLLTAAAMEEA